MLNTSFSPWPSFNAEEANAVRRVLLSNKVNYWTGTECREFEKEFASWTNTKFAVAIANGTLALDAAVKALGLCTGDEVVVTPRTFIASVSTVINAGLKPVFADVDKESGNITAQSIAAVLTPNTRAVICVHLAGWPCDMDPIMALASEHGLKVIEDCAQAHGARYKGRSVGSLGHIGSWSFCQDKIITTGGEGGMVTTNDEALWKAVWSFKDHGKSFEAVYERKHPPGFRWLHDGFGTNWRMLEMQAVIGRIQLRRIAEWTHKRQANAVRLSNALAPFSGEKGVVRLPQFSCASCSGQCVVTDCQHAYYKYYAHIRSENLASEWSRDRILHEINTAGVPCYVGSCSEVYLENAFDKTELRPTQRLHVAQELGETSLSFLVHPTITQAQMNMTCKVLGQVMNVAQRKE